MSRERDERQKWVLGLVVAGVATGVGIGWPLLVGLSPGAVFPRVGPAFIAGAILAAIRIRRFPWVWVLLFIGAVLVIAQTNPPGLARTEATAMLAAGLLPFIGGLGLAGGLLHPPGGRRPRPPRPQVAGIQRLTRDGTMLEVLDIGSGRRIVLFTAEDERGIPRTSTLRSPDAAPDTTVPARLGTLDFTYPADRVVTAAAERAAATYDASGRPDPTLDWTEPERREDALVPPPARTTHWD